MARTDDAFTIRLPAGMRPEIAARAKAARRSMNSEMVLMLQAALADSERPDQKRSAPESAATLARA